MSIGSIIRQLRRSRDMTQEELAEMLGISASAVSQWECDRVLPDVTQIPLLAEIFAVSADVILGIDRDKNSEKISGILKSAEDAVHAAQFGRAAEILRDAHRQYPRNYEIMERLANAIISDYSRRGIKEYDEVFRLCERILDECTDTEVRYNALDSLVTAYNYAGMKEKMLETAEQLPPFSCSKESAMLWRWSFTDKDGLRKRQDYLDSLLCELVTAVGLIAGHMNEDHSRVYSDDDRIAVFRQIVSVIETLHPDGDYATVAQSAENACGELVDLYLRKNDTENALYWLKKGCDFAVYFDTYDFDALHTSPAFRGYPLGGWIMENGTNHTALMLDWLRSSPEADPVRDDPRALAVMARLEKTAVKPEAAE